MWNKTEWKLVVKFVVKVGKTLYKPWTYKLKWKDYEELAKAPYVREATVEEMATEKNQQEKVAAVRKAKGMKVKPEAKVEENTNTENNAGQNVPNPNITAEVIVKILAVKTIEELNEFNNETPELQSAIAAKRAELEAAANTGAEEVTVFVREELEALSEADLRALYTAEQAKVGKQAPANIGTATIINNLVK